MILQPLRKPRPHGIDEEIQVSLPSFALGTCPESNEGGQVHSLRESCPGSHFDAKRALIDHSMVPFSLAHREPQGPEPYRFKKTREVSLFSPQWLPHDASI